MTKAKNNVEKILERAPTVKEALRASAPSVDDTRNETALDLFGKNLKELTPSQLEELNDFLEGIQKADVQKPKPNNVTPFPVPPGSPMDQWWKDTKRLDKMLASKMEEPDQREFYYQLLNKFYKLKSLENKSIPELDEMLQELIELKQI